MDMRNDQLDLESVLIKGAHANAANQLPPHHEEKIEDDGIKNPFSSHEDEEEEDGVPRGGDQEKKRKRDANYDEKNPKD